MFLNDILSIYEGGQELFNLIAIIFGDIVSLINIIFILKYVFGCNEKSSIKKYIIVFFALYLIMTILLFSQFKLVQSGGYLIWQIIFLLTVLENSIRRNFLLIIIALVFESFVQGIIDYIINFGIFTSYFAEFFFIKIIVLFVIAISSIVLGKCLHKNNYMLIKEKNFYMYLYFLLSLCFGLFMIALVTFRKNSFDNEINFSIISISCLIVALNAVVTLILLKKNKENDDYKDQMILNTMLIDYQTNYIEQMIENYKELRLFKHDVNAYLNTVEQLALDKKYIEMNDLIGEMKSMSSSNVINKCTNIYIAATINQFLSLINENDIQFNLVYNVFDDINMKSIDICSLFNNLIKNAIEANINNNSIREINISLDKQGTALVVNINNTVTNDFDMNALLNGITSKKDKLNHGLGLININKVINMYHGNIEYKRINDKLYTNIILLNVFD